MDYRAENATRPKFVFFIVTNNRSRTNLRTNSTRVHSMVNRITSSMNRTKLRVFVSSRNFGKQSSLSNNCLCNPARIWLIVLDGYGFPSLYLTSLIKPGMQRLKIFMLGFSSRSGGQTSSLSRDALHSAKTIRYFASCLLEHILCRSHLLLPVCKLSLS